eukprot:m.146326 g.146326  ORF g.146326 m.146326 type:complete len:340 (+) comp16236_c0_seq2:54-1073(+)
MGGEQTPSLSHGTTSESRRIEHWAKGVSTTPNAPAPASSSTPAHPTNTSQRLFVSTALDPALSTSHAEDQAADSTTSSEGWELVSTPDEDGYNFNVQNTATLHSEQTPESDAPRVPVASPSNVWRVLLFAGALALITTLSLQWHSTAGQETAAQQAIVPVQEPSSLAAELSMQQSQDHIDHQQHTGDSSQQVELEHDDHQSVEKHLNDHAVQQVEHQTTGRQRQHAKAHHDQHHQKTMHAHEQHKQRHDQVHEQHLSNHEAWTTAVEGEVERVKRTVEATVSQVKPWIPAVAAKLKTSVQEPFSNHAQEHEDQVKQATEQHREDHARHHQEAVEQHGEL